LLLSTIWTFSIPIGESYSWNCRINKLPAWTYSTFNVLSFVAQATKLNTNCKKIHKIKNFMQKILVHNYNSPVQCLGGQKITLSLVSFCLWPLALLQKVERRQLTASGRDPISWSNAIGHSTSNHSYSEHQTVFFERNIPCNLLYRLVF